MNENRSVATIDAPEFIDVKPFNPLISQCQIKVLYVGKNRNGSYIDKNTAIQMANSLPGTPIVGVWRKDIEDYGDHGHVIKIEDGEVKFSVKTVPYGFVAPDARVWFQKFTDTDAFGNDTVREYMMTDGYLWTGQYDEAMSVIQEGKGQSMELDESTLDGKWARDSKDGMEFFIINDALFSKLCILGDDVEPCFEGASITAKNGEYSTDADFAHNLYTMINQLKDALAVEGGSNMPKNLKEFEESAGEATDSAASESTTESTETSTETSAEDTSTEESTDSKESTSTESDKGESKGEETVEPSKPAVPNTGEAEKPNTPTDVKPADTTEEDSMSGSKPKKLPTENSLEEDSPEFAEKKKEDDSAAKPADDKSSDDSSDEQPADDKKKKVAKNSLADDEAIMKELEELRAFKLKIENERKDAVINKYHMLSDEDKANVVAHKNEYSAEQIDEKLALVYVRKNVDFDAVDGKPETEVHEEPSPLMSFSLDDNNGNTGEAVDAVQEALREVYSL